MFEKLLHNVVAKDVHHERNGVWLNLPEDLVFLVTVSCSKLILDEPRPMLIAAEFNNVVVDVLPNSLVSFFYQACYPIRCWGTHTLSS